MTVISASDFTLAGGKESHCLLSNVKQLHVYCEMADITERVHQVLRKSWKVAA
jgi:hypothetical protein